MAENFPKNLKDLFSCSSVNGRWGVDIVGSINENEIVPTVPFRGKLVDLGEHNGRKVYRLDSGDDVFVLDVGGSVLDCLVGAKKIYDIGLQGDDEFSLVAIRKSGYSLIRSWGYKCRSSEFITFMDGHRIELPESVLVAMKLVPGVVEKEVSVEFEDDDTYRPFAALMEKFKESE